MPPLRFLTNGFDYPHIRNYIKIVTISKRLMNYCCRHCQIYFVVFTYKVTPMLTTYTYLDMSRYLITGKM